MSTIPQITERTAASAAQPEFEQVHLRPAGHDVLEGRWIGLLLVLLAISIRVPFIFLTRNASTDAWARYKIALDWLRHPMQVPSEVWLPLHFWLLGAVLKVHSSELAVRLATLLLGALTVLPFWGLVRRVFDSRVAFYSAVALACFGMHVGYSTTTGSEVPTVFFMALGLYAWVRYRSGESWGWGVFSGTALSAACLCRYEPWVLVAVLVPLTISFGDSRRANLGREARRTTIFMLVASSGAVGWSLFSLWKWGSLFASANATMAANATYPIQHSISFSLAAVPVTLLVSLSPIVAGLALVGVYNAVWTFPSIKACLALATLALTAAHFLNSALHSVTQARYMLIYGWLWIPFAFQSLQQFGRSQNLRLIRNRSLALILFFVVWQAGVAAAAEYGPCAWGDRLGRLSPLLPFPCHLRELMAWLGTHTSSQDRVVVDNFNYEADDIARFAIPARTVFKLPFMTDNDSLLEDGIAEFVRSEHPRFVVYADGGQLGRMWSLADQAKVEVNVDGNDLFLRKIWQNADYRVYEVEY